MRKLLLLRCVATIMVLSSSVPSPALNGPSGHIAPAPAGVQAQTGAALYMDYDPLIYPMPVIQVDINGQRLPFGIDTGSAFLMTVEPWAVKQLNLQVLKDERTVLGPACHTLAVDHFSLPLLDSTQAMVVHPNLNPSQDSDTFEAVTTDSGLIPSTYRQPRLAGTIGAYLFQLGTVRFDFQSHTLTIYTGQPPPAAAGAVTLKLRGTNSDPRVAVSADIEAGTRAVMIVDTSAELSTLPAPIVGRLLAHAVGLYPRTVTRTLDTVRRDCILLPKVALNSLVERDVPVMVDPDSQVGRLGTSLLSRFLVTVSAHSGTIALQRGSDYATTTRPIGVSGICLKQAAVSCAIEDIRADSPAALAGAKLGDLVTSVDGRTMSTIALMQAQRLLDGYAGTAATVTVVRAGKTIVLTFERSPYFIPAVPAAG